MDTYPKIADCVAECKEGVVVEIKYTIALCEGFYKKRQASLNLTLNSTASVLLTFRELSLNVHCLHTVHENKIVPYSSSYELYVRVGRFSGCHYGSRLLLGRCALPMDTQAAIQ